ncbi:hypothetical protein Vretimale_15540 [Volvox reticuliferus]|uniref:RAP domain-containing protein n=1 Tax=Volvox reticuliferus TaxID=1737510 RepID=A0A8J4GP91_9CHLO|nr:hypothetical protein Vretifemale_15125 [Volvox reticuliferus]GIM12119.1 hypothetical protein Vretimale_15540 [Volvox reticuliferus]
MEIAVQLSGIPLVTKFRLLLPGWPGKLYPERQLPQQRHGTWSTLPAARGPAAMDLPPPQAAAGARTGSRTRGPQQLLSQRPMRRGPPLHFGPDAAVSAAAAAAAATTGSRKGKLGTDALSCNGGPKTSSETNGGTEGGSANSAAGDGGGGGGRAWQGGTRANRAWGGGLSRGNRNRGGGGESSDGSGGAAVWSQVRGADVQTWTKLVQQYGTTLGQTFAANALFRAAHFVNGAGALLIASNTGTPPPPPPPPPLPPSGVDAATFSALVQQLLGPITEAAIAGQVDGVRCSRLLWALAKLSGNGRGTGSESVAARRAMEARAEGVCTELKQEQQRTTQDRDQGQAGAEGQRGMQDRQGPVARRRTGDEARGPALPLSIMTEQGARCAEALAVSLLRQLAIGGGPEGAPGSSAGSNLDVPLRPSSVGSGGGLAGGDGVSLSGRLLVMAMWGLARLTVAGHMRYRVPGPAASSATAADSCGSGASCAVGQAELWDGLCEALRPRVAELQAREVSNAMWALASVRRCRHVVFEDLTVALEQHLAAAAEVSDAEGSRPQQQQLKRANGGCNVQDLSNAVWAMARAAASSHEGPSSRLLGLCEAAVLRALPQLQAQHVASLLWSFSMLCHQPTRHAAVQVVAVSTSSVVATPLQEGGGVPPGNTARAHHHQQPQQHHHHQQHLQGRPVQQAPLTLYQLLEKRSWEVGLLDQEDEGFVAQVIWSLARERVAGERALRVAARRLQTGANRLTLREAAMVASAYREARYIDPGLFAALLRRAGALSPHELMESPHADVSIALLLRGLAWAGCYDPIVYTLLCDALRCHLPSIQPQPLALALWALAEVQHRQPDFLTPATTVAAAIVGRFSGGELSCVALSLARLGVRNADFFGAAAVTLTALRGGGGGSRAATAAQAARELVPGEAAPVYGEEEETDDEMGEDEGEEEEEDEEEEGVSGVGAAPPQRRRRRGGRRYWLPLASNALRSTRWRRIDLLNPQELANVMAAFAISGNVDELLYYRAQVRTRRLLNASAVLRRDAAAAAEAATAAAVTGGGGGTAVAAAAAAALRRGNPVAGSDISAAAVTKLLWAFVTVGVQEPPLLRALAARLRELLQRLEPRDIAALAWALAVARLPDCNDLLSRAVHAAAEHARAFTPADLATVAWAAATVGLTNPRLMDACASLILEAPVAPAAATTVPGLKVLSDVAWAHTALRMYNPGLLARVAELAEVQLTAASGASAGGGGGGTVAGPGTETQLAKLAEIAPWLPADLELHHVVALLEAYATWAVGSSDAGGGGGGGGAGDGDCYHDGLFRAAAAMLLPRLDELTSDEVVTLSWCCAAVLHALPSPPPPQPSPSPPQPEADVAAEQHITIADPDHVTSACRHHHPVLELLVALSELIAATPADSFLQPELEQLAQVHAMAVQYSASAGSARGPWVMPAALMPRVTGSWSAAPAFQTRRLVVELCAALDEMGFQDVQVDARSEDGLVPVDVGAVRPPPPTQRQSASPSVDDPTPAEKRSDAQLARDGQNGAGATGPGLQRYAFLLATPELRGMDRSQLYWGSLAVRVRLLRARGWVVVVVPTLSPGPAGAMRQPTPIRARLDASQQRQYVRELLRAVVQEGSVEDQGAAAH